MAIEPQDLVVRALTWSANDCSLCAAALAREIPALFGTRRGAFIGAAVAVPLAGFGILPVLQKEAPEWSDAGTAADLAVNEPAAFGAIVEQIKAASPAPAAK